MKKFKRSVAIFVCALLIFERSVVFSFAQELEATPIPTPASTEEPVSQSLVETATPTATPTETPSDITVTDSASVTNNVSSTANTGQNVIVEAIPTPTPTPTLEVETGDALTVANIENEVNTNTINSEFVNHTLNIYLSDEAHDIDLNLLSQNAVAKVFGQDENFGEVVSVTAYSIDNFAYVENNIAVKANAGGNEIAGAQRGEISTGNAYSIVSLLNKINTNIVNSQVHVITINIFGSLTGNIILPSSGELISQECCRATLMAENSAVVVNHISSSANTGDNTIISAGGDAEIITGEAKSVVNVYNLINTNIVNSYFNYFEINNMGEWAGGFLGWSANFTGNGINGDCGDCLGDLTLANSAKVINNVESFANTGKNSVSGRGGRIFTGGAFSSVSIVNFINTNIIGSTGFIGFINIFGRLIGDIGGSEMFAELSPEPSPEPLLESESGDQVQSYDQVPAQKESGGVLEVSHTTNVGTHVLPGDTVTFFAKTKNTGTGTVYGVKLVIELFREGVSYGGAEFNLGDLKNGKSIKLTTGLVLSKDAPGGEYLARVSASGVVGPDDHHVGASSESTFLIRIHAPIARVTSAAETSSSAPEVLGEAAFQRKTFDIYNWLKLYFYLVGLYLIAKGYQKRHKIVIPVIRRAKAFALHLFSL